MNNEALLKLQKTLFILQDDAIFEKYDKSFTRILRKYTKLVDDFTDKELKNNNRVYHDADFIYQEFSNQVITTQQIPHYLSSKKLRCIASNTKLLSDNTVTSYFIDYLQSQDKCHQKILSVLISQYLIHYNSIYPPIRDKFKDYCKQTLDKLLINNDNIRLSLKSITPFKDVVFNANPAQDIISYLFYHYKNISNVLQKLEELLKIALGSDMHENCVNILVPDLLADWINNKTLIENCFLSSNNPNTQKLSNKFFSRLISNIIILINSRYHSEQDWCIKTILNLKNISDTIRFGDPRDTINHFNNWHHVDKEAKQIFIGWLYGKYIDFFFKTLFSDRNTATERKTFWSKYTSSLQSVKFFISIKDQTKFEEELLPAKHDWGLTYGTLDTESQNGGSVFVMEFSEFYILESTLKGQLAIKICAKDLPKVKNIKDWKSIALKRTQGGIADKTDVQEISAYWKLQYQNYSIRDYPDISVAHDAESWKEIIKLFLSNHGIQQK